MNESTEKKKRRNRGPTNKKSLNKDGKKKEIEWDDKGQPIGKNAADFRSLCGTTVRSKVPITIAKWHDVNDELKHLLWLDIEVISFQ